MPSFAVRKPTFLQPAQPWQQRRKQPSLSLSFALEAITGGLTASLSARIDNSYESVTAAE